MNAAAGLLRQRLPWGDPWRLAQALAASFGAEGLVWLDGDGSAQGQRSCLGVAPLETRTCRGLPGDAGAADPFELLAELAQRAKAGEAWLGWLGYEAGAWVEPAQHWQRPGMALLWAARFDPLLHWDHGRRELWLEGRDQARLQHVAAALEAALQGHDQRPAATGADGLGLAPQQWHWHTTQAGFAAQVERIRAWIAAGDLFQANLSACCSAELAAPPAPAELLALYGRLRRHCPAPFAGLAIGSGGAGGEAVLSASPERFLRLSPEGRVETRPIKGTRPRHSDPEADAEAAADLVCSPKDRAENVMIVDLLRNDLGRVCSPGSIQVPQLLGLESYRQVHHLTSVVEGQLAPGRNVVDLLRACWPGGSISGAPKLRALQRLNSLEPLPRGPYCGSLFHLQAGGGFDSSILIRTVLQQGRTLRVHAGCGIVADSDPAGEAEELGWKLQPLLEALA
ncbi:MAG: anthranilate synthase component I family protein [Prochlorococcaceae cyanobacterium]